MLGKLFKDVSDCEQLKDVTSIIQDNKVDELLICSVFDSVSGVYSSPFYSQNERTAIRSFSDLVMKDSYVNAHPDDFVLYALGIFNDKTGSVEPLSSIKFLARARDFIPVSSTPATTSEES